MIFWNNRKIHKFGLFLCAVNMHNLPSFHSPDVSMALNEFTFLVMMPKLWSGGGGGGEGGGGSILGYHIHLSDASIQAD